LLVHGEDGLDEITITGKTHICELKNDNIKRYTLSPEDLGLSRASSDSIKGGDTKANADFLRNILAGDSGPKRDIVLMNAAAALVVGDKANTFQQGDDIAKEAIDNGNASAKLDQLIEFSQSLG
jgi:anthranilate phosphoribosyltransferase